MVLILDTVNTLGASDVALLAKIANVKPNLESLQYASLVNELRVNPCKSMAKDIAYVSPVMESELSEPECELDPFSAEKFDMEKTPLKTTQPAQSTKSRKKRHASLIDKAFKGQQIQQVQDSHEDAPPEDGPVYIRLSDLTADWSRYMPKNVTRPSREPTIVNMSMKDTDVASSEQLQAPPAIPAIQALPKRNRKKSLIDKAASQQHREMFLANLQEAKQTTPKSQQPYCSLCQGRMGRTPCSLCSRQS